MIVLFTDFGFNGPYLGQVKAVLHQGAPGVPVIDLFADAPAHDPRAAAYLLAAYGAGFPPGFPTVFPKNTVFFAVVDPGVGGARGPGVLEADGRWYVGPDNGLFEIIIRRAKTEPRWWEILWRPDQMSETFHGRDLFAPVAARLARGECPEGDGDFEKAPVADLRRPEWPDDLAEIIYIDDFGNAMTGVRAETVSGETELTVGSAAVRRAQRFSDVSEGEAFFYENANGLLEIAVNRGRADKLLKLGIGSQVAFRKK